MINSVLGQISPDKLGQTLMHENFTFSVPGWFADATIAPEDYKAALETNLGIIKVAKTWGIKTIVDATPETWGAITPNCTKSWPRRPASRPSLFSSG